jgi:hypothetical protein
MGPLQSAITCLIRLRRNSKLIVDLFAPRDSIIIGWMYFIFNNKQI